MPGRTKSELPAEIISEQLVPLPGALAINGMGRSWTFDAIRDGRFPAPVKIGHASRWRVRDLLAWVDNPNNWKAEAQASGEA